jgi:hypothetical protein
LYNDKTGAANLHVILCTADFTFRFCEPSQDLLLQKVVGDIQYEANLRQEKIKQTWQK